ncbi:hypothetical protein CG747_23080 [Streptomyces sp. CB02959]|nr:hypothetical protein CG747_23080 [Streptomyces sp. CB02959]
MTTGHTTAGPHLLAAAPVQFTQQPSAAALPVPPRKQGQLCRPGQGSAGEEGDLDRAVGTGQVVEQVREFGAVGRQFGRDRGGRASQRDESR